MNIRQMLHHSCQVKTTDATNVKAMSATLLSIRLTLTSVCALQIGWLLSA